MCESSKNLACSHLTHPLKRSSQSQTIALWSASEYLKLEASVNTGYLGGTMVGINYSDLRMLVGMHKYLPLPTASSYNLESSHFTYYWTEERSTNKMCQVLTQKEKCLLALQIEVKLHFALERHLWRRWFARTPFECKQERRGKWGSAPMVESENPCVLHLLHCIITSDSKGKSYVFLFFHVYTCVVCKWM